MDDFGVIVDGMRLRLGILGLVLMGCSTATPVPDWTPPRAQAPPNEQRNSQQLAETESRSLPVQASPSPAERRTLMVGQAPIPKKTPTVVLRSESDQAYPRYQPRQPEPVPMAVDPAAVDFAQLNIDQFLGLKSSSSCAVVLLVDVSGSVFQRGVEVAVDAAAKVYARQSPYDRVWVVAFGSEPEMVVNGHGGTLTRQQLGLALTNSRPANSGTLLAPAIELATNALGSSAQARRVVVVSDGDLGDTEMAIWQAAHAWNEKSISFSTVHIGDSGNGAAILQEIAQQTQGRFISTR